MDLVIFDIHALQERFYFGDSVVPVLESAIPLLHTKMEQLATERYVVHTLQQQFHFRDSREPA